MLSYFLALKFPIDSTCSFPSQAKYAFEIVAQVNHIDIKISPTPLEKNFKLLATNGGLLPYPTLYRQLVGSFIYLTVI